MIRQMAHLQLITDQPAALVAFYTGILGLSLAFTVDDDAMRSCTMPSAPRVVGN